MGDCSKQRDPQSRRTYVVNPTADPISNGEKINIYALFYDNLI